MKIPHTVPKLIFKAYDRHLTPEQLAAQFEGRTIRSEDQTWDENLHQTLAQLCLELVIKDYAFYVQLTNELNKSGQKHHDEDYAKWQKDLEDFHLRRKSYEHKILAQEFRRNQRGRSMSQMDDLFDDDDDDDDALDKLIEAPTAIPDEFPTFEPLKPVLDRLNDTDRIEVIEELDVKEVPLPLAIETIPDVYYWERAALDKWPEADKDEHGGNWRRTYMEKYLWELIEFFHPFEGELPPLLEQVQLVAPHIRELKLINLIPNCFGVESRPKIFKPHAPDEELIGAEEDFGFPAIAELKKLAEEAKKQQEPEPEYADDSKPVRDNSHFDLSLVMPHFKQLRKLCIIYEMQEMGMDYEARFCDFTDKDVANLAKALTLAPTIEHFELNRSRMTSEQCKILVRDGLLFMPHLRVLNISYNNIRNAGAKAIARLLTEPAVLHTLHTLSMARNNIRNKGAKALAYALTLNSHLTFLDLRLNLIKDAGCSDFGSALVKNRSLLCLSLGANRIGEEGAFVMSKMIQHNNLLKELDLSSNNLGHKGGEYLANGMRNNRVLLRLDIRMCNLGLEFEYDIETQLKKNRNRLPYSLVDRDDLYPPESESTINLVSESEEEDDEEEDEYEEEGEEEMRIVLGGKAPTVVDSESDEEKKSSKSLKGKKSPKKVLST